MTVPIDEQEEQDRRDKYEDRTYDEDKPDHNTHAYEDREPSRHDISQDEDRVEPEERHSRDDTDRNGYQPDDRNEQRGHDVERDRDEHQNKGQDQDDVRRDDEVEPRENSIEDAEKNKEDDRKEGAVDDGNLVNLFVRNVAKHVVENQLVDLFSKYGKVYSSVVVRDPHTKECRGFGFVKMVNEEEAMHAIESLRDFEFEGRRISVEKAKRKTPHSRTPGAYLGVDRRIRERYAGIKRTRDFDGAGGYGGGYNYGGGYGANYPGGYGSYGGGAYGGGGYSGGTYGGGAYGPGEYNGMGRREGIRGDTRGRLNDRGAGGWDQRGQPNMRGGHDERDRIRRRLDNDDQRQERDQRYRGREAPVPREPADDYI